MRRIVPSLDALAMFGGTLCGGGSWKPRQQTSVVLDTPTTHAEMPTWGHAFLIVIKYARWSLDAPHAVGTPQS